MLTHCSLVMSLPQRSGSTLASLFPEPMLTCHWWGSVTFTLKSNFKASAQLLFCIVSWKIILLKLLHLPGANELTDSHHSWPYKSLKMNYIRTDPRFAPSQWETPLQNNAVSHWLGANLESSLSIIIIIITRELSELTCGPVYDPGKIWSY